MAEEGTPTMKDLLKRENVQIVDSVADWRDAVKVSLAPLERGGFVEPRYADNVIARTLEVGPYYVLTDDIALIHARPEEGAIKKQIAVTLLRTPVWFSDDFPAVSILFALAAEDSDSHIEAIKVIATICMEDEQVQALKSCKTEDEIYRFLVGEE
jgi:PTS system ascorbate-specific IIA component